MQQMNERENDCIVLVLILQNVIDDAENKLECLCLERFLLWQEPTGMEHPAFF